MLVMGLDPGLAVTGYGFVEGDGHEIFPGPYGVVRTSSRLPTVERLLRLHEELSDVVARHRPDVVAPRGGYAGEPGYDWGERSSRWAGMVSRVLDLGGWRVHYLSAQPSALSGEPTTHTF